MLAKSTHIIFDGVTSVVKNGTLTFGGGFYLWDSSITTANISFIANLANYSGEGLYADISSMKFSGSLKFYRNCVKVYGGGVYSKESKIHLLGGTFYSNFAELGDGGGIYCENTAVSITGNTFFILEQEQMVEQCVCKHPALI